MLSNWSVPSRRDGSGHLAWNACFSRRALDLESETTNCNYNYKLASSLVQPACIDSAVLTDLLSSQSPHGWGGTGMRNMWNSTLSRRSWVPSLWFLAACASQSLAVNKQILSHEVSIVQPSNMNYRLHRWLCYSEEAQASNFGRGWEHGWGRVWSAEIGNWSELMPHDFVLPEDLTGANMSVWLLWLGCYNMDLQL